jgi:hypothetical protein
VSAFVPYDDVVAAEVKGGEGARRVFGSGIQTESREFRFGDSYQTVNNNLDSSFRIDSWEKEGEYGIFGCI